MCESGTVSSLAQFFKNCGLISAGPNVFLVLTVFNNFTICSSATCMASRCEAHSCGRLGECLFCSVIIILLLNCLTSSSALTRLLLARLPYGVCSSGILSCFEIFCLCLANDHQFCSQFHCPSVSSVV